MRSSVPTTSRNTLPAPVTPIRDIIQMKNLQKPLASWTNDLFIDDLRNNTFTAARRLELSTCLVSRVLWYRADGAHQSGRLSDYPHEQVVLVVDTPTDRRYLTIHRCSTKLSSGAYYGRDVIFISHTDRLSTLDSTLVADCVLVGVDILDVVLTANVISERESWYLPFTTNCHWFAANFFTAIAPANYQIVNPRQGLAGLSKPRWYNRFWSNLRVVCADGRLSFRAALGYPEVPPSKEQLLDSVRSRLSRLQVPDHYRRALLDQADQIMARFPKDTPALAFRCEAKGHIAVVRKLMSWAV